MPLAIGPLFVGLAVFALALIFVHGDTAWLDAGEMSAAAAGLGVPHPTGFPFLMGTGHAASLLPLGPIPFRLSLVSAASMAITSGLICRVALRQGARPLGAALGALLFPAVFAVWVNGLLFEVYALNVLAIAVLADQLLRPEPQLERAAFVAGLGVGVHVTFVLSGALLFAVVLSAQKRWRRLPALIPWALFGALILAYLPVAASRDPFLNWGDPSTLDAFFRHLTAAGIRESFAGEMGAQAATGAGHEALTWGWLAGGPLFYLALGFAALSGWWVRPRHVWSALWLVLVADALFSVFVNPMGQPDLQTGMPGAFALAALVALGAGQAPAARHLDFAAVACAAALLTVSALDRWTDRPADDLAGVTARAALVQVRPGATAFVVSDSLASQSLYLQGVEQMRRDALVLVTQHVWDRSHSRQRFERANRPVPAVLGGPSDPDGQRDLVVGLAREALAKAPVYWELGDSRFDSVLREALVPRGQLFEVAKTPALAKAGRERHYSPASDLQRWRRTPRFRTREAYSHIARLAGAWRLLTGDVARGARLLEESVDLDPNPRALVNLAAARRMQGRLEEAIPLLERAVELDPGYEKARVNLATYRGLLRGR